MDAEEGARRDGRRDRSGDALPRGRKTTAVARRLVRQDVVHAAVLGLVDVVGGLDGGRRLPEALVGDRQVDAALAEPRRDGARARLRELEVVAGVPDGVGVARDEERDARVLLAVRGVLGEDLAELRERRLEL